MRSLQVRVKYGFDRVVAALLLVALSPLLGLIAIAVKLQDGGPVIFRHQRPGLGARPFDVWKFRTMIVDADRFLDESGSATIERVTRVGRTMRRLSLDELPQLFNILRGEMSFVGPRPAIMEHLPRYTDEQMGRFRMKPGVTGLAQVSGRNTITWSERITYDNRYIETYSLALDTRILLRTVGVVLRREGIADDRNPTDVDDLGPPRTGSEEA